MTYFSDSWAYEVRSRVSNPNWTVGLTAMISIAIHCIFLFYILPFTPAQIPIESSFGQVSLQLVASKSPAAQNPRPPAAQPAKKMVEPPKEIVREIAPAPVPAPIPAPIPEPVAQVVTAEPAREIQEIQEQNQDVQEPERAPAEPVSVSPSESVSDAAQPPSTGGQSNADQEIQFSSPVYSTNPKPEYPLAAQRAWNEGRVTLRVSVSETGDVMSLSVDQSSGYRILDLAAERAVKKWKFSPARRGRDPIRSECLVPITFHLRKGVSLE